jgi:hypothetical protein
VRRVRVLCLRGDTRVGSKVKEAGLFLYLTHSAHKYIIAYGTRGKKKSVLRRGKSRDVMEEVEYAFWALHNCLEMGNTRPRSDETGPRGKFK